MDNKHFKVVKEIPIVGGKSIKEGTDIYLMHGVFYLDGGMLPKDYQEDFRMLLSREEKTGWKHLCPIITRTAFENSKEGK